MTTEILKQITNISEKVKEINGDYYAEQFNETVLKLFTKHINDEYNEYQILIEALHTLIESDYKDKIIEDCKQKIKKIEINQQILTNKISLLEKDNIKLKEDNIKLKEDNIKLKEDNIKLKEDNIKLNNKINILENNKNKFDALVKLHECNALVNKEFKKIYKYKFNKKKGDYIPDIGEYINEPPTIEDEQEFHFWTEFNNKYPESNNLEFRKIYKQISKNRTDYGAHIDVSLMTKEEFIDLMKIAFPEEFKENEEIYIKYRDWLFMFPL